MIEEALIGETTENNTILTIDCGATGSLLSMFTLDHWDREGLVNVVSVNPDVQKRYKVANGQSVMTCSQVDITFTRHPELGLVTFDCTELSGAPPLLGMNYLREGVLNMAKQTLTVNGRTTRLQRKVNGHLVVNLASSEPQYCDNRELLASANVVDGVEHFNIAHDDSDSEEPHDVHDNEFENAFEQLPNEKFPRPLI